MKLYAVQSRKALTSSVFSCDIISFIGRRSRCHPRTCKKYSSLSQETPGTSPLISLDDSFLELVSPVNYIDTWADLSFKSRIRVV